MPTDVTIDRFSILIFLAILDAGQITSAARRLHMTQPQLSRKLKEMEKCAGFPLFVRTTRSITLSAEGERLVSQAKAIEEAVKTLEALVGEVRASRSLLRG